MSVPGLLHLFAAALFLVAIIDALTGPGLSWLGAVFALIGVALWATALYLQERAEADARQGVRLAFALTEPVEGDDGHYPRRRR